MPVVTGTNDVNSAAIGSGALADNEAHLYVGTSSWVACHVPRKKTDVLHSIASLPSGIPGRYLATSSQESAGSCRTFLVENVLYPDDGLSGPPPADVQQRLNDVASSVPAGANGVVFTPWLSGERSPVADDHIRAGWHHLSVDNNRSDMVRAVLEGVAHNNRWLHRYLEKFTGTRIDRISFVGGGATSPLWGQIFADVLDREIHRRADPRSAGVRGAALRASVALGLVDWERAASEVVTEEVHLPNPENRHMYDTMHQAFLRLYSRNKATHAKLAKRLG